MNFSLRHIAKIIHAEVVGDLKEITIRKIVTDSRKIIDTNGVVYAAISGERHDGHSFIKECFDKGIRYFIVEKKPTTVSESEAVFLVVKNTVRALQEIATAHRKQFHYPVIGITGSNGKTVVKEWLNQLLAADFKIIRSPKSYNSQVGVTFSVWNMETEHSLGIFEAGISQPEEMDQLEKIIAPTIAVVTTIGEAHLEHFQTREKLIQEKTKLFNPADTLVYCADTIDLNHWIKQTYPDKKIVAWSREKKDVSVFVSDIQSADKHTIFKATTGSETYHIEIPFTDKASVENAITCFTVCVALNVSLLHVVEKFKKLSAVNLRLQLLSGAHQFDIVNDSYSADLKSLEIALDYMHVHARGRSTTVILSDILQSGMPAQKLHAEINTLLEKYKTERLFGIGKSMVEHSSAYTCERTMFSSTAEFIKSVDTKAFANKIVLVKGAREFSFELIVDYLQAQTHETVLEVNLSAVAHNMHYFRSQLKENTRLMVMVKAAGYGTGSAEIARTLEFNKADYLAVAYIDEGVALRDAGVSLPIMVLNSELAGLHAMIRNQLEPEIFSLKSLDAFLDALSLFSEKTPYPVHIKLDTGMKRLGFEKHEIKTLCEKLQHITSIKVASIFTHLVGSEDPSLDDFTTHQLDAFEEMAAEIENTLGYQTMKHAANTGGIQRHPRAEYDMVRLGIGLYGISAVPQEQQNLMTVASLKTVISQIKEVAVGESVGYNRSYVADRPMQIATIPVGYADGLRRVLSNEKGSLKINGHSCPIVGKVCMDMTMIDVTGLGLNGNEEVEIFGNQNSIIQFAKESDTIPYEILTSISHRVKRIYIED